MLLAPYISPKEFYDTFGVEVDLSKYVEQYTDPNQSVSLLSLLRRSSAIADQWCKQVLRATVDNYMESLYPTKYNTLVVWPKYRPIVSVNSLSYEYRSEGWNVIDVNNGLDVFPNYFEYSGGSFSQFGKVKVKYSYVNGYAITQIKGSLTTNAVSITVSSATGISIGDDMTIYDGENSEDVTITGISGNVLSCTPLQYNHDEGLYLSAIPDPISQATSIIAANLLARGYDGHISSTDQDFKLEYANNSVITEDVKSLLFPYRIYR